MAGGFAALLDDIALIAKKAAASVDDVAAASGRTSAKAAGVVVDDTAVTPKFVEGVTPDRELPIILKITRGSLINKLLIILPLALLLSAVAPWALTPLLMIGGTYLSYEGAEKIVEKISGHDPEETAAEEGQQSESSLVKKAVMTDFILSSEIMVISLNEVAQEPFVQRALILIVVALVVTFGVYGFVGALVKMDDIGLKLTKSSSEPTQALGRGLVNGMPKVLNTIGVIGTAAMLWVGGHILLSGLAELGWHAPHDIAHHVTGAVEHLGGAVTWIAETFCSMVFGLIVGLIVTAVVYLVGRVLPQRR